MDDMFVIRNSQSSFLAVRMPNQFYSIGTASSMGICSIEVSREQLQSFIRWIDKENDDA